MSSTYNNKNLLLVLIVLAAIYFTTDYLRQRSRGESALPDRLLLLTEEEMETFLLDPPGEAAALQFQQTGGDWQVEQAGRRSRADQAAVQRLLTELRALEPQRLIANSEERWEDYAVTDSLATRVQLNGRGSLPAEELYIGRFNYRPPAGGFNQPMMGQQSISGTTYVRRGGDERIYAVDGFLAMSIPGEFDAWRSADFLRYDPAAVSRLRFDYPADSSFTLSRESNGWTLNGQPADSSAVADYLNRFRSRTERRFAADFQPSGPPDYQLTLERAGSEPLVVQCWAGASGQYYLHSSLNPTAYFESSTTDGLHDQLFVKKEALLSRE